VPEVTLHITFRSWYCSPQVPDYEDFQIIRGWIKGILHCIKQGKDTVVMLVDSGEWSRYLKEKQSGIYCGQYIHIYTYTLYRPALRPTKPPITGMGSFLGVKWPSCGVDHPPPPNAEVKERVELHLYSPSGPSWPVIG
jgi:hypothetical protein